MKETVKIEQVRVGDHINGKKVVEVLQRFDVMVREKYVRLVLEGGNIVDGYEGQKMVEVKRNSKKE